ncbi:hypothetical protein L1987_78332 [Smallanthus sonchifolius]|uniref:Uncharacterized protein n=1 Tax=Smallanthus sonchifolius TaxID=185202 RepID=A0ACB8ZDE7_9ASTR|nr:hypothetical protein L1987_78332 [Smallanthus sonchifolius]
MGQNNPLNARLPIKSDVAVIMYTSGSTGLPKIDGNVNKKDDVNRKEHEIPVGCCGDGDGNGNGGGSCGGGTSTISSYPASAPAFFFFIIIFTAL